MKRKTAAAVSGLLLLFLALAPGLRAQDCGTAWTNSPGNCKSNCMKSGVFCNLLDPPSPWSWNSGGGGSPVCAIEAIKPADPANGSYTTLNCTNNTWTMVCDSGFSGGTATGNTGHCSATSCHANIGIPPTCTAVNQCTDLCTACIANHTLCSGACQANVVIDHCATYNQCAGLCTACVAGYELVGNVCVGVTLKLSKNSVSGGSAPKALYQSDEPAVVYVTADNKVGVSTGNPQYALHVASGAGETGTIMAVSTGASNLFWVDGDGVHGTKFFINGSDLVNLDASQLTTGTVPLGRLWGITDAQIDAAAAIADTKLAALTTAGKVQDTALTANVSLLDRDQLVSGRKTYVSSVTVTTALGTPRVELAPGVEISSEASPTEGGGVRVSTNLYIVGFASATYYYGDGSRLTGMGGAGSNLDADTLDTLDSLDFVRRTGDVTEEIGGDKNFRGAVSVSSWVAAPRLELFPGVSVSSEASADLGGGVAVSTNLYVMGFTSATYYYGDGSNLTGLGGEGSNLNADLLDGLHGLDYVNRTGNVAEEVTGAKTFTSSMTVTTALGLPRIDLAPGVSVSSEASADLGGGVTVSSNVYIIGFASATKFYGDGSSLTGMGGSGSNLDADTLDTLDSLDFVRRTGDVYEEIGGSKSFRGAVSVSSWVAAPRVDFAAGVSVSSEAAADLGGGLVVSTNVYFVGYASAPAFYGNGSNLTALNASELASGTVPLGRLTDLTSAQISLTAGIMDTQLGVISTAGKVSDTALSTNVVLSDTIQDITGYKIFTTSISVMQAVGSPRLEMGANTAIIKDNYADNGAGVQVTTNVYIVGFASATYFYGDGSRLTGMGGAGSNLDADTLDGKDSLDYVDRTGNVAEEITGAKLFSSSVTVPLALGTPRIELAENVAISSEAYSDLGAGVTISSNVYIMGFSSAARYFGDATPALVNASNLVTGTVPLDRLTGLTSAQLSLTAGILDTQLDVISTAGKVFDSALSTNVFLLDSTQSVTGIKTFESTVTVRTAIGSPRVELFDNVSISSEASADLGAGVTISSNVYIVGFASATYFYGDGSRLSGMGGAGSNLDADTLDTLDSLDFVRRTGDVYEEIGGSKSFMGAVSVSSWVAAPRVDFAAGVSVSSEASADLGGGLVVSTNVYFVGYASAPAFFGNGAALTALNASELVSGTVPLERLTGLTSSQLSLAAGILDTQLDTISTTGKVFDSALSTNVFLLDNAQAVTGAKTFESTVTVVAALGSPRVEFSGGVSISSEASADLGGGVTVSSNVYVVGFASATKFYGDGSSLTGIGGAGMDSDTLDLLDSLDFVRRTGDVDEEITGSKNFRGAVSVSSWVAAPRVDFAAGVSVSSEASADLGGGLVVSTNVYLVGYASATAFYGNGANLTALNAYELASGTVPLERLTGLTSTQLSLSAGILDTQLDVISTAGKVQDTALSANVSLLDSTQTATAYKTFQAALATPRVDLASGVAVSSEASADLGGGVTVSSNVYVVGFASAAYYYGDGSHLTGIGGAGMDSDTLDLLHASDFVRRTGDVDEEITGSKNFRGAVSVSSWVAAPRVDFAPGVSVSSEASADLGGGLVVSTNVYFVGYASAPFYYGSGANLTALNASELASGTVPLDRLTGLTSAQLSLTAAILDTQLDVISTAGKVQDTALSANVSLLDSTQTATAAKTFAGTVTVAALLGSPRIELAPGVAVSSEASADLGAGMTVSSNVYVVGFASATKFYGDGSALTGIGGAGMDSDTLDTLDSLDFVRRTGDVDEEITGSKSFRGAVSVSSWVAAPRVDFAAGVSVSSEASADLGGGLVVSTNVYFVGYASAPAFYGSGANLTALNAYELASGTVPLERLTGLTSAQLSLSAGILDTQLGVISTAGKVADTALSANVSLLDSTQTVTAYKTFQAALATPRVDLAPGVVVSSEASADLGAGVSVSSNIYIVGFASAAKFFGDGSGLYGLGADNAQTLDLLDSTDFVRRTGAVDEEITGAKTFTSSATFLAGIGSPRLDLAPGVSVSSGADGAYVSSNLYAVGYASATEFYGSGANLTALNAGELASGTVPLDRLTGLTSAQLSLTAGIMDTQLDVISTAGKVQDTALSANVSLLDAAQTVTGAKTFASTVTVAALIGSPRFELAPGVAVSSEASADLGAGVTVSSNVYIIGFASAARFFGDGSGLTGIGGEGMDADTLDLLHAVDFVRRTGDVAEDITGSKSFLSSATVAGALGTPRLEMAGGIVLSSAPEGAELSTNVYVMGYSSAAAFFGNGAALTTLNAGELSTGTVPLERLTGLTSSQLSLAAAIQDTQLDVISTAGKVQDTALSANVSLLDSTQTVTGYKTFQTALATPRVDLAPGVAISTEASPAEGGGITISSNVYILGFASATAFFGDGTGLYGIGADNANTLDFLDALDFVRRTGDVGEEVSGAKTFTSSATFLAGLGSPRLELADGVAVSSGADGVEVSANIYAVGYASAAAFYGNGANLAALNAGELASGTVPLERLTGLTSAQLSLTAGILDTQLDVISTAGKVQDTALSSNVSLLDSTQTVTAAKTFAGTVTVAALLGAPRLELAAGVAVSSEASADLGGGVTVSSNVYVIGFTSATKFYGDGSALTGIGGAGMDSDTLDLLDSLDFVRRTGDVAEEITGAKTFLSSATVAGAVGTPRLEMAEGITLSSSPERVELSTNIYIVGYASATRLFGDASGLTNVPGDSLGTHVATTTLDMAGFPIANAASLDAGTVDAATVTAQLVEAPFLTLGSSVTISSAAAADGGGVEISTNLFVAGLYYGNGSQLTGILGRYVGSTVNTYNGNRGGYAAVHALCAADYAGAHVCSTAEIMFSINSTPAGMLSDDTLFPANVAATSWVLMAVPGFTANANDCQGWTTSGTGSYGALWNKTASGSNGFGSLQTCDDTAGKRKFACCK